MSADEVTTPLPEPLRRHPSRLAAVEAHLTTAFLMDPSANSVVVHREDGRAILAELARLQVLLAELQVLAAKWTDDAEGGNGYGGACAEHADDLRAVLGGFR